RIHADPVVNAEDVDLGALPGDLGEARELGVTGVAQAEILEGCGRELEQSRTEPVAVAALPLQQAAFVERVQRAVGGGAGEARGAGDRREVPVSVANRVEDHQGAVEDSGRRAVPAAVSPPAPL